MNSEMGCGMQFLAEMVVEGSPMMKRPVRRFRATKCSNGRQSSVHRFQSRPLIIIALVL